MEVVYLVDTYSLLEWFVEGNENYHKYFQEMEEKNEGFVTQLTLLEFYHRVLHKKDKETADKLFDIIVKYLEVVELSFQIIKEAGKLRSDMLKKKKELSYTDCVNYVAAKMLKIKLLTGDEDFQGMENVEFMK